jgi:hypothetical protein
MAQNGRAKGSSVGVVVAGCVDGVVFGGVAVALAVGFSGGFAVAVVLAAGATGGVRAERVGGTGAAGAGSAAGTVAVSVPVASGASGLGARRDRDVKPTTRRTVNTTSSVAIGSTRERVGGFGAGGGGARSFRWVAALRGSTVGSSLIVSSSVVL